MSSPSIREILTNHQKEQVLREYLGGSYDGTSNKDKQSFLDAVKDTIEREVDNILRAFVEDVQKGSPERKRRKKLNVLNLIITVLTAPGIAYAVNIENWILVTILSIVLLVMEIYLIISE